MNHYEVLGVRPDASVAEVRRAYVAAARRHHPDHGGSVAQMQLVNDAWAVLGDRHARRAYDRTVAGVTGLAGPLPSRVRQPGAPGDASRTDAGTVSGADSFDDTSFDDTSFDDRPLGRPLRPTLALVPVAMFAASIGFGSLAMVLDEPAVLGFAVLVFGLSLVAVAAVTLLAMRR